MQKIELIAMLEDSKKIIDFLQRKGLVEVSNHELPEQMYNFDTSYSVTQFEKFRTTAVQAKEILNSFAPQKVSLVDSFRPPKEIPVSRFLDMTDDADLTMSRCYDIIEANKAIDEAKKLFMEFADVFGILIKDKADEFPEEAINLLNERTEAKKAKNYARADEIREQLKAMGFAVEDTREGAKLKKI